MRISTFLVAAALTLGVGLSATQPAWAVRSVGPDTRPDQKRTYFVIFDEAPLALFRGYTGTDGVHPRLAGTSPLVTGAAKLDVRSLESRAYRGYLRDQRVRRLDDAAVLLGRPLAPTHVYDVATNGVAVELTDSEAARIARLPGVKRVSPDFVRKPLTDRGPRWIKADQIWSGVATGGVAKRGEGIVVGVIDTGINAAHDSFKATGPADGYTAVNPRGHLFGLCSTDPAPCNSKLIGIWDFTTGSEDRETNNGFDNYSTSGISGQYGPCASSVNSPNECVGHGTHTASTAAGNAVNVTLVAGDVTKATQMSGVAPHANLITYKACEAVASCQGSWLVAAIDQAVADQVDVINFSIGGGAEDPWLYLNAAATDDAEAFLAARAAGITVASAAGNDGPAPGTVGNPANAPWVLAVAAATHDRAVINRLVDMSGGASAPPGGGVLIGAGDITSPTSTNLLPIVPASDYPLCAAGSDPDNVPPTGVSKPPTWNSSTWTGKIVVCTRGYYARVAKSNNVRLGGGAGMVLVNSAAEGEDTVNDDHSIPSTHMTYANGQALLAWLASGSGHKARLEGTTIGTDASVADHLADFSSRGPVVPLGVLKPEVTAPGVNIIAANNAVNSCAGSPTSCYRYLDGTSMATPHAAGAAALLKSVHPGWTPSQIISALMLTARPSVKVSDGSIATPHEQGAGMLDVSLATNAGLYLNVSEAQFRAANLDNARNLNLPSLTHDNCFLTCSLSRTFTDMAGGGKWNVSVSMPGGGTITPSVSSFTIGDGASQAITFNINVDDGALVGQWAYGSVTLTDASGHGRPALRLPVAIYVSPGNLPSSFAQSVPAERGHFDVSLNGLVSLVNPRYIATDLVKPTTAAPSLNQDSANSDPFDDLNKVYTTLINVPATGTAVYRLHAGISSPTSVDSDLYVGEDLNGDGKPSSDEVVCTSANTGANESCDVDVVTGNTAKKYWVLVQNYTASSKFSSDVINLETFGLLLQAGSARSLVVTGPGHSTANTDVALRFDWDDASFLNGQTRVGYLIMQANAGTDMATIPVRLTRNGSGFAPFALANGIARTVTLPAGAAHDRLYFDVPPNATSVTFATAGSGSGSVKLEAYRIDTPAGPTIAAAPTGTANASSSAAGLSQSITLSGGNLSAGRWYLKPTNTGGSDVAISVTAKINTASTLRVLPGSYYNPARGGHGVFVYPAADQWQLIWYTYLQDGTPTWYFVQSLAPGNDGTWNGVLYRSAWNGSANYLTQVGNLLITPKTSNTFTMSYNIDGETGSEPMSAFITGCPVVNGQALDDSAHWYSPGHDGFGYSVQVNPGYEFVADFVYDAVGVPRFLVAERLGTFNTASTSLPLDQLKGFCPLCDAIAPTRTNVGTLTRTYSGTSIATMGSTATFVDGVPGSWNATFPVTKLGLTQGCATP